MFLRRRLTGLSLAFLLFVMQAFWLVHRFKHDLGLDAHSEAACEFCLAMHGRGAAMPGAEQSVAVIFSREAPLDDEPVILVDAWFIEPRQQGPPRFS
ncbi:MAG: hypothetical protein LBU45_03570 [Azoarcus sp.]|jgi:hypothetical protein|nr:hypothetical protein [Azoarcus sp.]